MSVSRLVSATAIALFMFAADVTAQGFAVTGGAHANPDQFYGAGLYEFAPMIDGIAFRPGGEIGRGDGATLLAVNGDFTYALRVWRRSQWRPYIGGGPALNHYRLELYSQTEPGANAIAGLRRAPWHVELRVGFFESPTMTFGVGYAFRHADARRRPRPRR